MSAILLEVEGIGKSFPGVRALAEVRLGVRAGRLLALLGENGAGKSTLMNILSGVFPPDCGTIRRDGRVVRFASPWDARAAGIGTVFQELNLIPHLTVAENIFLGREPCTGAGMVDYRRLNADAAAVLRKVDLDLEPTARVADLRISQQQLVEIARAISTECKVLILDEPTSSLSAHEVEVLFKVVMELKKRGVGIIYITHKFEELAAICDDVTIFRDGCVVGEWAFAELSREKIVRLMAGREEREGFKKRPANPGAELLRAENITVRPGEAGGKILVNDVSLTVARGEIVGVFGLVGAGRTELLETLFGLHARAMRGKVFLEGEPVELSGPAAAIAAGVALAPEDRKRDGLVLPMSVAANASLASLARTLRAGLIDPAREARHVAPCVERFRVKTASLGEQVINLSGGNQQKVILAKWLATGPRLLLLDEPTRGVDVNAKQEIYGFIDELAQKGLGLIVVSSELPEILALSDRVIVLCEGRKTAEFSRAEATAEKLLNAALPDRAALAS